jgi:hypothetical protein
MNLVSTTTTSLPKNNTAKTTERKSHDGADSITKSANLNCIDHSAHNLSHNSSESPLHLNAIGRVECWDGYCDPFRGEGIMTIVHSATVKQHIRVVALGCVAGTGTAVLIDETRRVWLFQRG